MPHLGIGLGLGMQKAGGAGVVGYSAPATNFNKATPDYLTRGGNFTGLSDGGEGTISFWPRPDEDASILRIFQGAGGRVDVQRRNDNRVHVKIKDTGGAFDVDLRSISAVFTVINGYHHVMASWKLSTDAKHLYTDDVSDLNAIVDPLGAGPLDYTAADYAVGADVAGGDPFNGCFSELWFDDSYIDLSVEANRRKFITAAGRPVNLGSIGQGPTGSQPILFLTGSGTPFVTNLGSGGGMTDNGAVSACSSTPPDT